MKGRKEITHKEKIDFAKKLKKIDPCSGILDFYHFPQIMMKMIIVLHSSILNTEQKQAWDRHFLVTGKKIKSLYTL